MLYTSAFFQDTKRFIRGCVEYRPALRAHTTVARDVGRIQIFRLDATTGSPHNAVDKRRRSFFRGARASPMRHLRRLQQRGFRGGAAWVSRRRQRVARRLGHVLRPAHPRRVQYGAVNAPPWSIRVNVTEPEDRGPILPGTGDFDRTLSTRSQTGRPVPAPGRRTATTRSSTTADYNYTLRWNAKIYSWMARAAYVGSKVMVAAIPSPSTRRSIARCDDGTTVRVAPSNIREIPNTCRTGGRSTMRCS